MPVLSAKAAIQALGIDLLNIYLQETFEPSILALGLHTVDAADEWLDARSFVFWASKYKQRNQRHSELGQTSLVASRIPGSSSSAAIASPNMHVPSVVPPTPTVTVNPAENHSPAPSPSPSLPKPMFQLRLDIPSPEELDNESDLPEIENIFDAANSGPKKKRKRSKKSDDIIEISSGGEDARPQRKQPKRPLKRKRASRKVKVEETIEISDSPDELIKITRQVKVKKVITLTSIPSTWSIPRNGSKTAYLLDLRNEDRDWPRDKEGNLVSMATLIFAEDQDSWTGPGSAGSTSEDKAPLVPFLGPDVLCQAAAKQCGGCYHCSEIDPSILEGCERYEADPEGMKEVWRAERELNAVLSASNEGRAVAFYNQMLSLPCKARDQHGDPCPGASCYRERASKIPNFDGKIGFVGCSKYNEGSSSREHRFVSIPIDIDEDLIAKLFKTNGKMSQNLNLTGLQERSCAKLVTPRIGLKGRAECHYPHLRDGRSIQGKLKKNECHARIRIWSPLDREDRRAIVILEGPHNHPMFPSTKVSRDAKEKYKEAVMKMGVEGATPLACDKALTTQAIFGTLTPSAYHPGLANTRVRRDLVKEVKREVAPHGHGLEGVLHYMTTVERVLPERDRYVHKTIAESGFSLILTLFPGLVERLHDCNYSVHDNTYKRVYGDWKEWEVVIWDAKLDMRLTVARFYCTNETRVAFRRMWQELWDLIEVVTKRPVLFKFMDGEGIRAIIVDGCKAQVQGCGDDLVDRARKRGHTLFMQMAPDEIVQYVVRTCLAHLDRKFIAMAKEINDSDVIARIRRFPFLKTRAEVDEFVVWCQQSPYRVVAAWIEDKKPHSWWIPSINQFMSKIPPGDWMSTPSTSNLNEGAHPHANQHTGINNSVLEAIKSIRKADAATLQFVNDCEDNCVLRNSHNSQAERDRSNRVRREARGRKVAAQSQAQEAIRNKQAQIKQLQREVKEQRESAGIKRTPTKKGVVGKVQTDFELSFLETIQEMPGDPDESDSGSSMYGEEASPTIQRRLALEGLTLDLTTSESGPPIPQTPARRPEARLCTPQSERTFWRQRDEEGFEDFLKSLADQPST
ncbi:hypothetical protein BKA70DRAFT_1563041 [Coprinopsis sp. MPI-PUGE-AT-0042]|nr:hypothetical protein BKA70DRAFT_1569934 [Coprinopsis sp. MPI-PUGE-AT-0042]KAH6907537.1 hypothetical protein BKA70DRAFT_1563041 [Coprinopsis sp. MPI-PUGE-AT-0042]